MRFSIRTPVCTRSISSLGSWVIVPMYQTTNLIRTRDCARSGGPAGDSARFSPPKASGRNSAPARASSSFFPEYFFCDRKPLSLNSLSLPRRVAHQLVRPLNEILHIRQIRVTAVMLPPGKLSIEEALFHGRHLRRSIVPAHSETLGPEQLEHP